MVQAKSKKKSGVGDFKKSKIKIGRKLAPRANETPTDFKSKRLQILNQSVAEDKGGLVNKRRLNLADLLSQSRHYSPNVRRDAMFGLKDLLERHPEALAGHVGAVIEALCERVTDAEATVRHALRVAFMYVLGLLDERQLAPFAPLLVVHVCSGMTHIAERTRIDALPLVDALLDRFPAALAPHTAQLLPNYAHILASRAAPVASVGPASPSAAHAPHASATRAGAVLASLRTFAARLLAPQTAPAGPAGFLRVEWAPGPPCRVPLEAGRGLGGRGAGLPGGGAGAGALRAAGERVVPLVAAMAGEALADEAGPPSLAALAALRDAAAALALLLPSPAGGAAAAAAAARGLARAVLSRFPLEAPADDESLQSPAGAKRFALAAAANVAVCEALSLALPPAGADWPPWARPVSAYTLRLLSNEGGGDGDRGGREADGARERHAGALLAVLERLLACAAGRPAAAEPLWRAALAAFERAHPLSRAKRAALDTLARALSPPAPGARPALPQPPGWLAGAAARGAAKLVCELRGRAPEATEVALRLLLALARRPAGPDATLPAALAPLFARHGAAGRVGAGPIAGLGEGAQRAALEVVFHAAATPRFLPAALLRALAAACNSGLLPEPVVLYALELLPAAAAAAAAAGGEGASEGPVPAAVGFLVSLLAAAPPGTGPARAAAAAAALIALDPALPPCGTAATLAAASARRLVAAPGPPLPAEGAGREAAVEALRALLARLEAGLRTRERVAAGP